MPTHDSMKPGKRIVSGAVAGILAVSMTPAIALAEEPIEQNAEPATAAQDLEAEQPDVIDATEEDAPEAPQSEAGTDEAPDEAVEAIEGEEAVIEDDEEAEEDPAPEEAAESEAAVDDAEETAIDETAEASDDAEEAEEPAEAVEATETLGTQAAVILQAAGTEEYELKGSGVTVCKETVSNKTFNVAAGQALLIEGTDNEPLVFENCIFNLSGMNLLFKGITGASSYYNGETAAKLCIGKNVTFKNCTFITGENASSISGNGNDACINLHNGDIAFKDCNVTGNGVLGQFMGLYGASNVTFNNSHISTVGNTGGWSYAMYGTSVLSLIDSTMTATGMQRKPGGGNVNAFYSGDHRTYYDAIFLDNSTIDFSDNNGGGFAINNVNINVKDSTINVLNNAGNACNSGYWNVENSDINMSGNKAHGLSCIGFEMTGGSLTVLHNGYAGIYVQSRDSSLTGTDVKVMCNGERLLSYTAGDIWLNSHILTLTNCNDAWLGAIGRKGTLVANNCANLIAYDLFNNKLKGNTETIIGEDVTLGGQDEHYLFLNPALDFDYARGNTEGGAGNSNDSDLFDQIVNTEEGVGTIDRMQVIGPDAKIGSLTTAQLSHHSYDWEKGELTDEASPEAYGVIRYACTGACDDHAGRTKEHPTSFDCTGTYVYAPVVGVAFDTVLPEGATGEVQGMPDAQTRIMYKGYAERPADPTLEGYVFTGWYADAECTVPVDFSEAYTNNWTVLYAGWEVEPEPEPEPVDPDEPVVPEPDEPDTPDTPDEPVVPEEQENVAPAANSSTVVASYEVAQTQESELPQSGDRSLQTVAVSLAALVAAAFTAVFAHRRRRS